MSLILILNGWDIGEKQATFGTYMVSRCQEQDSIMNFAVGFLKMLSIYMLCRAQFLLGFYVVFCVYQILILLPLVAEICDQKVSQKDKIIILFFFYNSGWEKLYKVKVTKSAISPQRKLGSFSNFEFKIIRQQLTTNKIFMEICTKMCTHKS